MEDDKSEQSHKTMVLFQGLLEDDRVLAGALWRHFFDFECKDAEKLEKLVHYVHKQVHITIAFVSFMLI